MGRNESEFIVSRRYLDTKERNILHVIYATFLVINLSIRSLSITVQYYFVK